MRFAQPVLYTVSELGMLYARMRNSQVAMATPPARLVAAQQYASTVRVRNGWVVKRLTATSAT